MGLRVVDALGVEDAEREPDADPLGVPERLCDAELLVVCDRDWLRVGVGLDVPLPLRVPLPLCVCDPEGVADKEGELLPLRDCVPEGVAVTLGVPDTDAVHVEDGVLEPLPVTVMLGVGEQTALTAVREKLGYDLSVAHVAPPFAEMSEFVATPSGPAGGLAELAPAT